MNWMQRRRAAMMGATSGGTPLPIPAEYQEVEWIESSGNVALQFANLYLPKEALTVTGIVELTPSAAEMFLMADRDWNGVSFGLGVTSGNKFHVFSGISAATDVLSEESHTITFIAEITKPVQSGTSTTSGSVSLGGTIDGVPFSNSQSGSIRAFGRNAIALLSNGAGQTYYVGKMIGRLKVFTDELYYDFVPCYRISDMAIGVYEAVNGTFVSNANLTKGADV